MSDWTAAGGRDRLLTTIQAARGGAALAVVFAHASTILGFRQYFGELPLRGALGAGIAGVDFFFVLSGFVIATVHWSDIGRPAALRGYVRKRVIRIYPIYWIAVALLLLMLSFGLIGSLGIAVRAGPLLRSVLLLPQHETPLLSVAWTLQHEMLFYLVFALLIMHRQAGLVVCGMWFLWSAATVLLIPNEPPWAPGSLLIGFLGSSYHLQFAAGILAAIAVARGWVPSPRRLAAGGGVAVAATALAQDVGWLTPTGQASRLCFGVSSGLLIAGLAAAERQGAMRAPAVAVFLGAASYAVYLVHVPAMAALAFVAPPLIGLPEWVAVMALAAGGTAAGIALHVLVERPMLRTLRRRLHASDLTAPAGPPRPLGDVRGGPAA
ncbi:MAG: acyltransferase [Proteobacteria bacterium]|nr:acyltransferase [Pseudomonadota bacterium]